MTRVLFLLCLLASPLHAATYIVLPDGSGDYPTIQSAVDAVQEGDVIELGDGTFTGEGNRDIDLHGKDLTVRSASGQPAACVIDCAASGVDLHRAFFMHSGESSATLIADVTITEGYETWGGALAIYYSAAPVISGCIFRGNTATLGGAVYLRGTGDARFENCIFEENSAEGNQPAGAGVCCDNGTHTFVSCTFQGNIAAGFAAAGGGVQCRGNTSATFEDCLFVGNFCLDGGSICAGGGGFYAVDSAPTVLRCTFTDNHTDQDGGALTFLDEAHERVGQATVGYCTITGNGARYGASVSCCGEAAVLIEQCTLVGNAGAEGAGGVSCGCYSSAEIVRSIIASSTSGEAVGCAETASALLTACLLYDNAGGDWVGRIADQLGVEGNVCLDPCFCANSYWIAEASPCHPDNNGPGVYIGAYESGCLECGDEVPVQSASWGQIKALFRAP